MLRTRIRVNRAWLCAREGCETCAELPQLDTFFRARNWLALCRSNPAAIADMRWLYTCLELSPPVYQLSTDRLMDALARAMVDERIHVCPPEPLPAGKSSKNKGGGDNPDDPNKKKDKPPPKPAKTWVEFKVVDMEGNPVSGYSYLVMLPDGSLHEGKLDKTGKVRFNGIEPGTAVFTLTDVDRDLWERVE